MNTVVTKTLKVRIGKQDLGRLDEIQLSNCYKEYRVFIRHPELEWEMIGTASTFEVAMEMVGNALMKIIWTVKA